MIKLKFIDTSKFFNHTNISYFFSILLFLTLFRELKSRNYIFVSVLSDIGNFALYSCIVLSIIVFFVFVKEKKFPIILFLSHSLFYFLLIFFLDGDFSNLDIKYILKRNFQILILIFVFFIALKTEIKLDINRVLKYTSLYIFLLFLLSALENKSFSFNFSFESISRINVISYFVITLFAFSFLHSNKPNKLIILLSSFFMITFASKFFLIYLLIILFFYYLNSIKRNRFYIKSVWILSLMVISVFYTIVTLDTNKISKLINSPVGNFLKLDSETKLHVYDGAYHEKIDFLKFKEKIGNTENSNKKRLIYSKLYSDLYTGFMTRILLNKYYLENFILRNKILTNDKIIIRIDTHSIYLPDKETIQKLPVTKLSLKYQTQAAPLYEARRNFNKVTKELYNIGIDDFLNLCLLSFDNVRLCMEDIIKKNYQHEEHNFESFTSNTMLFSAVNLKYAAGFNLSLFSSHNSFINFISNFSYLGLIYILLVVLIISNQLFKNKISSNFVLMFIFMIIIHSSEDYLFSNAFQISILSFFILGKFLKKSRI